MNNSQYKKKKGYVLVAVMVVVFFMSAVMVSTFTIAMRYMFSAKKNLNSITEIRNVITEEYPYAWY